MIVAILHDRVTAESRLDEVDVLHQAALVEGALRTLGHEAFTLPVDLDLGALEATLRRRSPDLAFNLVESIAGYGRLIHVVPALLESIGLPFTGCGSTAHCLTTNKLWAKELLHRAGIPTPAWHSRTRHGNLIAALPCTCILKPVWEDASVGIDDDAVLAVFDQRELEAALDESSKRYGEPFAEQFVEGRELNLSLLADGDRAEVLPPAEIEFVGFPAGKPHIVGYAAKWQEASFEYEATTRSFPSGKSDQPILERLRRTALECWSLFGLRGYARVDFRVDAADRPWVLEVNANPCLAPDAGFMAAARQGGLQPEQVIDRILAGSIGC